VRSLAYYRQVLEQLTPAEREPAYVDYIARRFQQAFAKERLNRQNHAVPERR
jgi:hypothetical protein